MKMDYTKQDLKKNTLKVPVSQESAPMTPALKKQLNKYLTMKSKCEQSEKKQDRLAHRPVITLDDQMKELKTNFKYWKQHQTSRRLAALAYIEKLKLDRMILSSPKVKLTWKLSQSSLNRTDERIAQEQKIARQAQANLKAPTKHYLGYLQGL